MKEIVINIAKEFSRYPAGRYLADGPANGEKFREEFLVPILREKNKAIIFMDGTRGYGSSFLEEAFGGLRRAGYSIDLLKQSFQFEASDKSLIDEIWEYVAHGMDGIENGPYPS